MVPTSNDNSSTCYQSALHVIGTILPQVRPHFNLLEGALDCGEEENLVFTGPYFFLNHAISTTSCPLNVKVKCLYSKEEQIFLLFLIWTIFCARTRRLSL